MSKEFSKEKQALDWLYDISCNVQDTTEEYNVLKDALLEFERLDLLLKLPSEQSSSHFTYKDKHLVCMQLTKYSKLMDAFLELQSIKEAKPSEVLENLIETIRMFGENQIGLDKFEERYNTIKQSLIKAQEQEKVIIELCEYCGMDNLYPYDNLEKIEITFKDKFDNYQRQRIESLGRLNKQEKVLEIIKDKKVNIDLLYASSSVEQYNDELVRTYGLWFAENRQLTQEEFDTLKRWQRNDRI